MKRDAMNTPHLAMPQRRLTLPPPLIPHPPTAGICIHQDKAKESAKRKEEEVYSGAGDWRAREVSATELRFVWGAG